MTGGCAAFCPVCKARTDRDVPGTHYDCEEVPLLAYGAFFREYVCVECGHRFKWWSRKMTEEERGEAAVELVKRRRGYDEDLDEECFAW